MPEQNSSVRSVVEAMKTLGDDDVLAVIRALVEQRPGLSGLLPSIRPFADDVDNVEVDSVDDVTLVHEAEVVDLPVVVDVDEIIDVPIVSTAGPVAPEPDYTEGGVPTFDRVREKIEGRVGTSIGSAELAHESPAGKSIDEQWDERQNAARAKLDEIRRSMGK
ncbi:PspA/IM30 family protein [Rhodococcus sp. 27YEA15]|uniref:PspA/IM30 family protein n=1 Tax=Rhodococcus sp. 27YEA15 TaxID=3156259 RepID=UPI003C7B37F1